MAAGVICQPGVSCPIFYALTGRIQVPGGVAWSAALQGILFPTIQNWFSQYVGKMAAASQGSQKNDRGENCKVLKKYRKKVFYRRVDGSISWRIFCFPHLKVAVPVRGGEIEVAGIKKTWGYNFLDITILG